MVHRAHFGVFVELPGEPFGGLIRLTELPEPVILPELDAELVASVLGYEEHNRRLLLAMPG